MVLSSEQPDRHIQDGIAERENLLLKEVIG